MTKSPLVILACGAKKHNLLVPRRADLLYTGPLFTSALAYARTLAPEADTRILSAKHGLLALSDFILPYEQRLNKPGSILLPDLAEQMKSLDWRGRPVTLLAGNDYCEIFVAAWYLAYRIKPTVSRPLQGLGLGQQIGWLKTVVKEAQC